MSPVDMSDPGAFWFHPPNPNHKTLTGTALPVSLQFTPHGAYRALWVPDVWGSCFSLSALSAVPPFASRFTPHAGLARTPAAAAGTRAPPAPPRAAPEGLTRRPPGGRREPLPRRGAGPGEAPPLPSPPRCHNVAVMSGCRRLGLAGCGRKCGWGLPRLLQ